MRSSRNGQDMSRSEAGRNIAGSETAEQQMARNDDIQKIMDSLHALELQVSALTVLQKEREKAGDDRSAKQEAFEKAVNARLSKLETDREKIIFGSIVLTSVIVTIGGIVTWLVSLWKGFSIDGGP